MMQSRLKIGWLIYAIALTAVLLGIFWMSLQQPYTVADYVDIPLTIGALAGVYGYALNWRLGRPWVWLVMLVAIIVWDIVYNFFLRSFTHWGIDDGLGLLILLGVGFLIFLPEYIALLLYCRPSDAVWGRKVGSC